MDETTPARPAGFWIRVVAFAIDLLVYWLVMVSFSRLARLLWGPATHGDTGLRGSVVLFTVLFAIVYTTTLHAITGQTIGKGVVGIRVVSASDGALLTIGPALLRHLASFLSSAVFGLGYLMAGLRRDKRALHDLIAGSRVEWLVVRRRASRRAAGPTLQDAAVAPAPPPAPDPGPGA
jgi:uncharacterized RDD family membrane protein YckC